MNFGVNQRPQTVTLPDLSGTVSTPVKKAPEFKPSQILEASVAASFSAVSSRGDSLTSVMIFLDEASDSPRKKC